MTSLTTVSIKDLPPHLKRLLGVGNTLTDLKRQLSTHAESSIAASSQSPARIVGLGNQSQNCWCNSLLQMVMHVPSLRIAYETFARAYEHSPDDAQHARALLRALEQYETSLRTRAPVPSFVSQEVRLAMNHFFPRINSSALHAEDAHEALQLIMSGYEQVVQQSAPLHRLSLYTLIETTRVYESLGEPRAADPERLALTHQDPDDPNAYVRLADGITSLQSGLEYQIVLNLQGHEHLQFNELFMRCFHEEDPEADPAVYLRADDQLQDFKLKRVDWRFRAVPQELVLVVGRFGYDAVTNQKFKIFSPLNIPRSFQLPSHATPPGRQPIYDLSAFIVHKGGAEDGHYITYRRLEEGTWVECNDSVVTERPESDIQWILHNPAGSDVTSYIHYYKLRSEQAQAERLSVRAEITPPLPIVVDPPSNSVEVTETSVLRKITLELNEIGDLLKWCGDDDPLIARVRLWHKDAHLLLRSHEEDLPHLSALLNKVANEVSPQLRDQLIQLCREDLIQLRATLIAITLENALINPADPQNPFPPHLFEKNGKPIIQRLANKLTNRNSAFFSERLRYAAELKEVGDYLPLCNPNEYGTRRIRSWQQQFTKLLGLTHLNLSQIHNSFIQTLESILKDPRDSTFPPILFGLQAEPIFQFMSGKMRDKHSVFFSENFNRAFERYALQESIDRIDMVGRRHVAQTQELEQQRQAAVAELHANYVEYNAGLAAIHDQFVAATAPYVEEAQQLRQQIPIREQQISNRLDNLQPGIVTLQHGNIELAHKIQITEEAAQRVESEQAQLSTATAELEAAIQKAKDDWMGNFFLQGLLIGGSLLLTWGASSLIAGATFNIAKAAGATVITVGLATVDPGKGKGPRRGPQGGTRMPRGAAR